MQNRAETEMLGQVAVHVCRDWVLIDVDEAILGGRVDGALEHVIHEMSHAASLGIPWDKHAAARVGGALDRNDDGGLTAFAIAEETRAWAIEWNVWRFFDLPFEWLDLADAAEVQNCDPSEVEGLLDQQDIRDLAAKVYRDLLDFLRGYEVAAKCQK